MSHVWWDEWGGLTGYLGFGTGLEWRRHSYLCVPGLWRVSITGWTGAEASAVVDDFGNLVQVPA